MEMHFERYKELMDKYKVSFGLPDKSSQGKTEDDFDVIIERIGTGYAHTKYRVIKNRVCLSTDDLAILCDGGNVRYGYRIKGPHIICIYTD